MNDKGHPVYSELIKEYEKIVAQEKKSFDKINQGIISSHQEEYYDNTFIESTYVRLKKIKNKLQQLSPLSDEQSEELERVTIFIALSDELGKEFIKTILNKMREQNILNNE